MMIFKRDDGLELNAVAGFRNRVLSYRHGMSPRSGWSDDRYAKAVEKRFSRGNRLIRRLSRLHGSLHNAEILEIGCGDGLNSLLLALKGVRRVVGVDLNLKLNWRDEQGDSVRRLVAGVIRAAGTNKTLDQCLRDFPVSLLEMDATSLKFPDGSFDLLFSRSVLEHIHPLEKLFDEIGRVLRPGGIVYHEIDPFFWLRGCHKRGLVDIPWAHARLTTTEYHRFVVETEGPRAAEKRLKRLMTLNRLTLRQWKDL
jgi:SAM-dependent methyltransferase